MSNITIFCSDKKDVVEYVEDMLEYSGKDFPWTMTILPGKSEDCFARIVTVGSSEGTEHLRGPTSYEEHMSISPQHTLDG